MFTEEWNIEPLIPFVDKWIIDIKDLNPDIYLNLNYSSSIKCSHKSQFKDVLL